MRALPIMVAVLCVLAIAYRYYSAFIAAKVLTLNDLNVTPAHRLNDGHNYHPTHKWVLFGHHFAAISGAGPLIGPVLAALLRHSVPDQKQFEHRHQRCPPGPRRFAARPTFRPTRRFGAKCAASINFFKNAAGQVGKSLVPGRTHGPATPATGSGPGRTGID